MTTRVLVVDDAATVRMYHGSLLREAGFEVAEAANGVEALEAALTNDFDLFLIDVNMPKMDGYTCVGELRGQEVTSTAPIVMISTEDAPVDAEKAYAAGANLYLVKPVSGPRLVRLARMLTGCPDGAGTGAEAGSVEYGAPA
jgi:two-component system, chemotaxis family, chemotaxis protein CheY